MTESGWTAADMTLATLCRVSAAEQASGEPLGPFQTDISAFGVGYAA